MDFERGEPDGQADGESHERGDDDSRGVHLEPDTIALHEQGGHREEEGEEHDDRVDLAGCTEC